MWPQEVTWIKFNRLETKWWLGKMEISMHISLLTGLLVSFNINTSTNTNTNTNTNEYHPYLQSPLCLTTSPPNLPRPIAVDALSVQVFATFRHFSASYDDTSGEIRRRWPKFKMQHHYKWKVIRKGMMCSCLAMKNTLLPLPPPLQRSSKEKMVRQLAIFYFSRVWQYGVRRIDNGWL